jgi:hypothetical protein
VRIHIIFTNAGPLRVYESEDEAYQEYIRLRDLDDLVGYSVISMELISKGPLSEKTYIKYNRDVYLMEMIQWARGNRDKPDPKDF